MKKIVNFIYTVFIITILFSCADDGKEKIKPLSTNAELNKTYDLNISLLLDLSDRINPDKYPNESMDYYKRDVGYINSVSKAFDTHIRSKKVRKVSDKIQLFFDPEPKNSEINSISKNLKFFLNRNNITRELLSKIDRTYSSEPEKIYELAIKDGDYIGSNTWGFFKNKVNDYCIEKDFRNLLIILTDGYIYHEENLITEDNLTTYITPQTIRKNKLNTSDWKDKFDNENFGFLPLYIDLSDLEILVLGINPDVKNPYEEDVIIKYWSDWFVAMKVKRFEIKSADLPSNMAKVINNFIRDE